MRLLFASAMLAAVTGTALFPESARPAYPGKNGLIAFVSERKGHGAGVYTMHTDGTGLRQLTGSAPYGGHPALSPDGRTVAFARDRDDDTSDVWLVAANGTQLRPLLHDAGELSTESPAWSPDGRWVAFVTARQHYENEHIALVRPDGTGRRTLVTGTNPTWTPDGKRIVFDRGSGIWTIGIGGRGLRRLHNGTEPAVSPDGRRIAFLGYLPRADSTQVFVMDANGAHAHQLTKDLGIDIGQSAGAPAWSPDGKLIAFGTCCDLPDGSSDPTLAVVRPDGSGRRTLARGDFEEAESFEDPVWMRDGGRILYASFNLMLLNADGSGKRPFFPGAGEDMSRPVWSPDGRRLLVDTGLDESAVLSADGRILRRLRPVSSAVWSPDGRRVLGVDFEQLDIVDLATGKQKRLVGGGGLDQPVAEAPAWSSKGEIAWLADQQLAFTPVGMPKQTRYTEVFTGYGLDWSPDGRLLAYDGGPGGSISVYDTKTKRSHLLIRDASQPAWSPDGRRIAYVRNVTKSNTEIFVARSDGSGEHKITSNPGLDISPSWQPLR
jgi:Tol biopolymer transport system component